jgi:diguanylate cyclase (GGDEF)-like protein/PAS domain S-box-containing protein
VRGARSNNPKRSADFARFHTPSHAAVFRPVLVRSILPSFTRGTARPASGVDISMQSLHSLSRDELIALVEALERRLALVPAAASAPQDALSRQMLAALDAAPIAIFSGTLAGTILSWSRGAEQLLGYRAAEIIGHGMELLLPEERRQRDLEALRARLARGEAVESMETVAVARSGERIDVRITAAPLFDVDGTVVGASLLVRDLGEVRRLERELSASRTSLRSAEAARSLLAAVVESSQDAIIAHDFEGRVLSWNRGARELFGYSQDEIIGCDYRVLLADVQPGWHEAVSATLRRGEQLPPYELSGRHRDGDEVPISVSLAGLRTQQGEIVGVTAVIRNISGQRAAQLALRASERQLESVLDHAAEAILVLSAEGHIERMNQFARRMFGCEADALPHLDLRQMLIELRQSDAAAGAETLSHWIRRLVGGRRELTGRRLDGSLFALELSLSEIALPPGPSKFTAVVRDITERKSWESRIYSLAYSDPLTGLPNRLLLRDRLEHAIAAAQRNRTLVGVLFLDLDYFKAVNDAYGHHTGDHLLREIAERAKGCVREIDTVSRIGGDEFVLVLPELREAADAGAVARKILAALSQPCAIDGRELRVTPTVGISIYPHHGADAESLLRNADAAMYHAKEGGKNDFRYFAP